MTKQTFEQARDEHFGNAAMHKLACKIGADWSRTWVLKNDPIVLGLVAVVEEVLGAPYCLHWEDHPFDIGIMKQALENYKQEVGGL